MIRSDARKYVAVENERPSPVPAATYTAKHAGHFGIRTRITPETIQPVLSQHLRANVNRGA